MIGNQTIIILVFINIIRGNNYEIKFSLIYVIFI